jgi:hypothetical protein
VLREQRGEEARAGEERGEPADQLEPVEEQLVVETPAAEAPHEAVEVVERQHEVRRGFDLARELLGERLHHRRPGAASSAG